MQDHLLRVYESRIESLYTENIWNIHCGEYDRMSTKMNRIIADGTVMVESR